MSPTNRRFSACRLVEEEPIRLAEEPELPVPLGGDDEGGAFFESLAFDVTGDPRTSLSIEGAEAQFHEFQPGRLLSCVYVSIHGHRWRQEIDNVEAVTALVLPRARSQDEDTALVRWSKRYSP